jgi:DNA-directed RNA polymerase specialized sigma24 family protein
MPDEPLTAAERVTLDTRVLGERAQDRPVIDVDNALRDLEALDPALAQIVEMRYFGGYTDAEIVAAMDIADRTVRRNGDNARAFILTQLHP